MMEHNIDLSVAKLILGDPSFLFSNQQRTEKAISSQKSQLYCTLIVVYSVERAAFSMKALFPGQKTVVRNTEPSMQTCRQSIHTGKCSRASFDCHTLYNFTADVQILSHFTH